MAFREVPYTYRFDQTLEMLTNGGLLLASTRADGTSNVMTIGWASIGVIWGLPVMVVLVRPSRYTYQFVEASQVFTVNVPTQAMRAYVNMWQRSRPRWGRGWRRWFSTSVLSCTSVR
jgi:flavin reductase (DIM6/NTAB) family NADH-FMN oxidoreductase RutF